MSDDERNHPETLPRSFLTSTHKAASLALESCHYISQASIEKAQNLPVDLSLRRLIKQSKVAFSACLQ